jgi:general stress protein 26
MAAQESTDRVWDIIEKVGVGMLTTHSSRGLRARPVEARPDRKQSLIWFVTDVRGSKDDEIETNPDIGLIFIDRDDKAYLSLTCRATVLRDPDKAAEIWKKTDDMWWQGPRDPNVRVLRVEPVTAELWDGPSSTLATVYEIAKARITGDKPNLGENRKSTVAMSWPPRHSREGGNP